MLKLPPSSIEYTKYRKLITEYDTAEIGRIVEFWQQFQNKNDFVGGVWSNYLI